MTEDKSTIEDLFSEEDIPFDIETEPLNTSPRPPRKKRRLTPVIVIGIVLLGLFYLAYTNHNHFYITTSDGQVEVQRILFSRSGRCDSSQMLPTNHLVCRQVPRNSNRRIDRKTS